MQTFGQTFGRKPTRRFVALITLSAGLIVPSAGGTNYVPGSWQDWEAKAMALMDASQLNEACVDFRNSLREALHSEIKPDDLLRVRNSLATAYALAGQFAQAETEFQHTLSLEEKIYGAGSYDYALTLAALYLLPTHTGDRYDAIRAVKNAIAKSEQGLNTTELVTAKDYLAKLLYNDRRYAEAESVLLEAQAACLRQPIKGGYWIMAELSNDLGVLREHEGRYAEAAELDSETIKLIEDRFGKEFSGLVAPMNNLATIYARMGRLEDAEAVFEKADDLCLKTFGMNHLIYASLLRNHAIVLKKLGKKKESKKLAEESEEIEEASNRSNGVGETVSVAELRAEHE